MRRAIVMMLLSGWIGAGPASGDEPAPVKGPLEPTLTLKTTAARVHSVDLSTDGKLLVTGAHDYKVRLWDVGSGREIRTFGGQYPVILSKDGKWLVTADSSARLWELATGKLLRVFDGVSHRPGNSCLALSDDSKWLVFDKQLFDRGTGRKVHDLAHGAWDDVAAFSADGKRVVTAGGAWIRLWDVVTGKEIRVIRSSQSRIITAVALSKDGKLIVTNDDLLARLWDADTGKEIRTFKGHANIVSSVVLSADDTQLATAGGSDNTVVLWDMATGKEIRTLKAPTGNVYGAIGPGIGGICAAMTPNGKWLATASDDGTARLWDLTTGKQVRVVRGWDTTGVQVAAVSPDGAWLVNRKQKEVHLWDMTAGKPVRGFETDVVWQSVSLTPGGKRLVALGEHGQSAQVWDTATGKPLRTFKGLTGFATLSHDGTRLVTGDKEKLAWLWDVDTGKAINALEGHDGLVTAAALSEDGRRLVTAGDATARLWDTSSGQAIRVFKDPQAYISSVALSRDGKRLLTGGVNHVIRVWDVATGKEIHALQGGQVKAWSMSPDGNWLVTTRGPDRTTLWDLRTGLEVRSIAGQKPWVAVVTPADGVTRMFTIDDNGYVRIWDAVTGKESCRLANLPGGQWAVCDAEGRFDASNCVDLDGMHWVVGNQTFPIGRFADRFHDPGMLAKHMGFSKKSLRPLALPK